VAAHPPDVRLERLHDDLRAEYGRLADAVAAFDARLVTIKGWGVTLSLASLGLGFQQDHYGLFLVAALSGLAFWVVESSTKLHQMRHYPRMREIEVLADRLYGVDVEDGTRVSSPRIDWGWTVAGPALQGNAPATGPPRPWGPGDAQRLVRGQPLLYPHVAFPHAISVVAGAVLFAVGLAGGLGPI